MKLLFLVICSVMSLLPNVQANTLLFSAGGTQTFNFGASATYQVDAAGNSLTQTFVGSPIFANPNPPTIVVYDQSLVGTTILDAILNLSGIVNTGTLNSSSSFSLRGNHSTGQEPTFGATAGDSISISALKGGTQTVALNGTLDYDLTTYFLPDLKAGNALTITFNISDTFATTSPASSTSSSKWKNETATYSLTQTVYGTQSAFAQIHYLAAATPVPEPLTMVLTGAGLLGLGIFGRRKNRGNDA